MIDVVAAAVVRDGRVLAAHRVRADEAGWEFPGGKVEAGEDHAAALRRECHEELGLNVSVGPLVADVSDGVVRLSLYLARSRDEPVTGADHDALRWVCERELDALAWLPLDRGLVPGVVHTLRNENQQGTL